MKISNWLELMMTLICSKLIERKSNRKCSKNGKSRGKHMPPKQKNLTLDNKTYAFSL